MASLDAVPVVMHTYQHPDGRLVEHPGRRVNCSICMCDPRYNPELR